MNRIDAVKRAISISMAGVLLATAPGLGVTRAVAAVVTAGVQVNPSLGGMSLGAAGVGIGSPAGLSSLEAGRGAALPSLSGSLSSVQLPSPVVGGLGRQAAPVSAAGAAAVETMTGTPGRVSPAASGITVRGAAPILAAPGALTRPVQGRVEAGAAPRSESLLEVRGQPNRLGLRFQELRGLFGQSRDAADIAPRNPAMPVAAAASSGRAAKPGEALESPAASETKETAPAGQVPAPGTPAKAKGWGLSAPVWWFIGSLLAAQVGVEALGSSMPALIQKCFGDFTIYAQVAVVSSIFGIIGRQFGPMVIEKVGIKKAYVASYLFRVVSITAVATLLATGHMTLPLMYLFYSANALLLGTTFTAMNSVPPLLVGQNDGALNRFWGIQHTLSEIFGILGPIATGIVIAKWGFIPALAAFPVMTLLATLILWKTLKLPADAELKADQPAAPRPAGIGAIFKEFGKKIGRGAKVVWNTPVLRYSFLAYTLFLMLNPFLYQMLAPGYALRLIGTASPELAPAISGWLTGLYSLGGLLGGVVMTVESRRLDKGKESGTIDEGKEKVLLNRSLLRWVLLATAALAFLASMAVPMPVLGSLVALPGFLSWAANLTLPALALIPFGIAQVVAQFKLQSFFQARVPKQDLADAMGFLGSASLAVTTVGIIGLKTLFKSFPVGLAPFYWFSLALIPVAALALFLRYKLAKQVEK